MFSTANFPGASAAQEMEPILRVFLSASLYEAHFRKVVYEHSEGRA
jgi:hypothetical protein